MPTAIRNHAALRLQALGSLAEAYELMAKEIEGLPVATWDDDDKLERLLKEAFEGLTIRQDRLAELLRTQPATVNRWKTGANSPPRALRPVVVAHLVHLIREAAASFRDPKRHKTSGGSRRQKVTERA